MGEDRGRHCTLTDGADRTILVPAAKVTVTLAPTVTAKPRSKIEPVAATFPPLTLRALNASIPV